MTFPPDAQIKPLEPNRPQPGDRATSAATPQRSALTRLVSHLRRYVGYTCVLKPVAGLEPVGQDARSWRVVDDDAYLEVSWTERSWLRSGHYRLKLHGLRGLSDRAAPSAWVDTGLRSSGTSALRPSVFSKTTAAVNLLLTSGARRVLLDPGSKDAVFSYRSVRLRRLTRPEYYMRLALGALAARQSRNQPIASSLLLVMRTMRHGGLRKLAADLRRADQAGHSAAVDYQRWIERHDTFGPAEQELMKRRLAGLASRPLISVVMPVYNTPEDVLRAAVASVIAQAYENWELCIADDCSSMPHVQPILVELAAGEPRIKLVLRKENGRIAKASNSALALASGEWTALLDHDDLLAPTALAEVALFVGQHPDAEIIYSDEDKIAGNGLRYEPYFKPDFSREMLRSQNYFNHLTVYRTETLRAVGAWRPGFEGSQDFDVNLRIFERVDPANIHHIPKILYHWRALEGSTALDGYEKSYAHDAGKRALEEHLARTKTDAKVEAVSGVVYRILHAVSEPQPLVSIIIPTRDRWELLRNCVDSIRQKTTYSQYEILIVDNDSVEPETKAYLAAAVSDPKVHVLPHRGAFNFSAINNSAVSQAKGSIVALVNNDIEVISPDWLTEMVSWAQQPDIGCVGAKLYYANDTIQHAGVILGIGGVAGHSHKSFPRYHEGYFSRLRMVQNLSAVTGACLVVRKAIYEQVGGLEEANLAIAFNDVDFCLKVREAGYLNIWTPFAELYHLESESRGAEDNAEKQDRFNAEADYMLGRWSLNDPYYSPNLTLDREDFSLSAVRKLLTTPMGQSAQ
ncbi:glycosyltransferase family 2 protein [Corticibacterium sp. UT-5YL-CI-8]|nr:glycosyltransferase family 2 protein [Tianweitania sp. UT-5YL-CI-8]